jgi:hypothetical protein
MNHDSESRVSTRKHVHDTWVTIARTIGCTSEEIEQMSAIEYQRRRDERKERVK